MNNRLMQTDEESCSRFGGKDKSPKRNGVKFVMMKHYLLFKLENKLCAGYLTILACYVSHVKC